VRYTHLLRVISLQGLGLIASVNCICHWTYAGHERLSSLTTFTNLTALARTVCAGLGRRDVPACAVAAAAANTAFNPALYLSPAHFYEMRGFYQSDHFYFLDHAGHRYYLPQRRVVKRRRAKK